MKFICLGSLHFFKSLVSSFQALSSLCLWSCLISGCGTSSMNSSTKYVSMHADVPTQASFKVHLANLCCSLSQFQSFSQYRSKLAKKPEDEIRMLKASPKVFTSTISWEYSEVQLRCCCCSFLQIWNVHSVLNVLHSLVEKSNINRQLEVYTSGGKSTVPLSLLHLHYLCSPYLYFSSLFRPYRPTHSILK